jgi:N-acetyl-gamma-glutamyl-phosphate reductase
MTIASPAHAPDAVLPSEAKATPEPARTRARIGLLGATGYSGQEFIRLAIGHPGLDLVALGSREHAGQPVGTLLPGIDPRVHALPAFVDPPTIETLLVNGEIDTVVACLPHGAWKAFAAQHPAIEAQARHIVDLSSDHRDGASGYVYGLPEAFRSEIPQARRLANPGCYPTAAALALLPAAEAGWLDGPIMVSALSGVSGAGRSPALRTSFVELEGGAALYKAGTAHQHVPEMERVFGRIAGASAEVAFAPQLAPMARGILLTATAKLARECDAAAALELYRSRYENETFVRVLEPDQWPETRSVKTSNRCDVAVTVVHGGRTLLASAALDNLVKGAAGQAIQNLNLMLGWPEDWGLPLHGNPW